MAVDATHASYDLWQTDWQMLRDVVAGQRKVHAAGTAYLPKLSGQDDEAYAAYKRRAVFLNATGRTLDGLSGMIFRKPPTETVPTGLEAFMQDVTSGGLQFQAFAEMVVDDVIAVGRCGILVEYPEAMPGPVTRAQQEASGRRPYWTHYRAESIIDWRVEQVNNQTTLTQVRLMETAEEPEGEFDIVNHEQIRVLDLWQDTETIDREQVGTGPRYYRQRLFRKVDGKWQEYGNPVVPTMNGATMSFIPFVFIGPRDTTPNCTKPPLLDLANVNLSHYTLFADYRHTLFKLAPTPYLFGVRENEVPDGVGPDTLWTSQNENAKAGIIQASSDGLSDYRQALQDHEAHMAMLGARMLAPERRQAETAEALGLRLSGEHSVLSSLAQSVSLGLTRALEWAAEWSGLNPDDVSVELNRDFLPMPMSAQDLAAVVSAWQTGAISTQTMFENLKRGEIIAAERSFEDERADVQDEGLGSVGLIGAPD